MTRTTAKLLLLLVLGVVGIAGATPARAQSLNRLGVDRLNADAQSIWAVDGLPRARDAALAELQKQVGVARRIAGSTTLTVVRVNGVTLEAATAPGLTRLDGSGIEARLPLAGEWRVAADVRVRLEGRVLFIPFSDTFNVQVEVKRLRAGIRIDLDSSDPAAPRLVRTHPPDVRFEVGARSANFLASILGWIGTGAINGVGPIVCDVAARFLARQLNLDLAGLAPPITGAGGPALAPVAPADLAGAAARLETEIHRHRMPFGSIFEVEFDRPYHGTWEDSILDPAFDPGVVNGYESIGDSALMTGQYLAGLAFHHAVTRDAVTHGRAREVLRATRTMLTMKGRPGDLNRLVFPVAAMPSAIGGTNYAQAYQGVDHVMSDYISRDAYMGTFFGLSLAHDLIADAAVKRDAREQLEMAIDYLLANGWTWRRRDGSFGERWAGASEHQYAWVLAAHRVNPAKYAAALDAHKGYADILWLGLWIGCLDPYYSYYKFNLAHGAMYTALRLETDPVRWQRAHQGLAILKRTVGHHQNAHFNNVYLALDPAARPRLGAENANLLTRWLRAPRRKIVVDLTNDPTIEKTTYTVPFNPDLTFGPGSGTPRTILVAKHPIPVDRRLTASSYIWSKSPLQLTPGFSPAPDAHAESETVDFTLPYWMARYYRAIPGPRPTLGAGTATAAPATATAVR